MKKKIIVSVLTFLLVFTQADRCKAFLPVAAIPVTAIAAAIAFIAGGAIYSANPASTPTVDPQGFLQTAGYFVQWVDAKTPGDLTGAIGPEPFGYPIYYGADLADLFPAAAANPGVAPFLEGVIDDYSGDPTLGYLPVTGDHIPCLTHVIDNLVMTAADFTKWGNYDSLNRISTVGFHNAGYTDTEGRVYFGVGVTASQHVRMCRAYYPAPDLAGYWRLDCAATDDLLPEEYMINPGGLDLAAASQYVRTNPVPAYNDLNNLLPLLPATQVKVAGSSEEVSSAPPYGGLTPAQLQAALAANNAAVLQAAADIAQAAANADPTNTVATQTAASAQAAAAQAATAAAQAEVEQAEIEVVAAPALTPVLPGAIDFTPISGLGEKLMTKQPFVYLTALDGIMTTLIADPVPPSFTIDLGFTVQEIDFTRFNDFAAMVRSIITFLLLIGTIFFCVQIWSNQ